MKAKSKNPVPKALWQIQVPKSLDDAVKSAIAETMTPKSEFVRVAVREKLERIKKGTEGMDYGTDKR